MTLRARLALNLSCLAAFACHNTAAPSTTQPGAPPPTPPTETTQMTTPATTDQRPGLRKGFTPSAEFLARHVSDEIRARAKAYVAAHPDLPPEIRRGIEASEIWIGMTAEEVRLVLGEPARTEGLPGKPGHQALLYPDEGWVFRFDERDFLYEYVER